MCPTYGVPSRSPGQKYLDKNTLLLASNNLNVLKGLINKVLENNNLYMAEIDKNTKKHIEKFNITNLIKPASVNPFIVLKPDPLRFLKSKQKNELLNKIKKNDISIKLYRRNLEKYLKLIFQIEQKSYKRKKNRHIFNRSVARKLFRNIIDKYSDTLVYFLYFNGKPIAHMMGFCYEKNFLEYHMAFLENFKKFTPGKILILLLLLDLQKKRFLLFDFSRGDSLLKQQFTQERKIQYDVYITKNRMADLYIFLLLTLEEYSLLCKLIIKKCLGALIKL